MHYDIKVLSLRFILNCNTCTVNSKVKKKNNIIFTTSQSRWNNSMHAVTFKHFYTLVYFKSRVTDLVKWSSFCHNDTEFTFSCSILEKRKVKRKKKEKGRKGKKKIIYLKNHNRYMYSVPNT